MASVKILLYKKKTYTDGTHPIIIQIISGKTVKRKVIANVFPEQWNDDKKRVKDKKHDNYISINAAIRDEFNRVEDLIMTKQLDIDTVFKKDEPEVMAKLNFWAIADLYLEKVKKQSAGTYRTTLAIVNKFKEAVNDDTLLLSKINEKHIRAFNRKMDELKNGSSTQNLNWRYIRFISNFGHREKYDTKPEALHSFKLPSRKSTKLKSKLTKQELQAFANVDVSKFPKMQQAQDTFLLSVYLRGVRVSDMIFLKQTAITGGRYQYTMSKNDKSHDIKLVPEAQAIVNRYLDGRKYLFDWYKLDLDPETATPDERVEIYDESKRIISTINNKLSKIAAKAGISKTVRNHISRHTFAKIAADGIEDRRITMALLGHSDLRTHQAYITEVQQSDELDDAVDGLF